MIWIKKGPIGTQWFVMDDSLVLESFDDEQKAIRFVAELRKADNDRLLTLQEEAIQAGERSNSVDKEREEEVRGITTSED